MPSDFLFFHFFFCCPICNSDKTSISTGLILNWRWIQCDIAKFVWNDDSGRSRRRCTLIFLSQRNCEIFEILQSKFRSESYNGPNGKLEIGFQLNRIEPSALWQSNPTRFVNHFHQMTKSSDCNWLESDWNHRNYRVNPRTCNTLTKRSRDQDTER